MIINNSKQCDLLKVDVSHAHYPNTFLSLKKLLKRMVFGLLFGLISFDVTNIDASEWNQWRGNLRDGSHKSPIPWPESIDKNKLS